MMTMMHPALHFIPALICAIVAFYSTEAARDAWRDVERDRFDLAWPLFITGASLLSVAGAGISFSHMLAWWMA